MDERERLAMSGQQAAAQAELARLAQAQARGEVDADSLEYKKFSEYDAESGTVSLTDSRGGVAAVSSQGSLSNAAIAAGDPVSPYGWQVADWSPTIVEPRLIEPTDFSAQPGGGNGSGLDDGDGGEGEQGGGDNGDGGDACTSQLLCYRGEPYEDPAENEPPAPGTCNEPYGVRWAWVYLSVHGWRLGQDRVSGGYPPFEIYITTPGQPNRYTGDIESRSRAALISRDENGNEIPPVGYNSPGSDRRQKGYPAFYRIGRGDRFNYPTFYGDSPPAGWTAAPGVTYSNPVGVDVSRGNGFYVSPSTPPDDCGDLGTPPPAYGPPAGNDPEAWRSICSNAPPINYTVDTNSDRSLVTVTDANGELARLDFEPGQYQIKINCKEDGCDTEPNCETQRFWSRPLPEPACPFEGGQCEGAPYQIAYSYDRISNDGDYQSTVSGTITSHPISGNPPLLGPISTPFQAEPIGGGGGFQYRYTAHLEDGSSRNNPVGGNSSGTANFTQWDITRTDGQPDNCGNPPECDPPPPGPWQSGVLSFNPPMQTSVAVDGATGEHTVSIFDASTTAAAPLTTVTFPDANYETAVRCDGDGAPDP